MKIDLAQLPRALGLLVGWIFVLFGVMVYVAGGRTATEQNGGVLVAILGLQLVWFLIWLRRSK